MATKQKEDYTELSDVKITRVGLCKSPAVPDATHVILKSRDEEDEKLPCALPGTAKSDDITVEKILMGLSNLIKSLSGKSEEPVTKATENEMDISKATVEEIQKANPALFDALVAKARLESVKEKDGSRVASADVQDSVADADGKRAGKAKLAGVADAAVDEKSDTVSSPKDDSQNHANGGVAKTLEDLSKTVAEIQKGMGQFATTLQAMQDEKQAKMKAAEAAPAAPAAPVVTDGAAAPVAPAVVEKIDTSRPGEAAEAGAVKAAVKATQAAVVAEADKNDSGIGGEHTEKDTTDINAGLKDELGTLKEQVATLTKSLEGRTVNLEKAFAKMIRDTVAKTETSEPVAKTEGAEVVKARSAQAGQLDDEAAKAEGQVRKSIFGSAITAIAMANAGRRTG